LDPRYGDVSIFTRRSEEWNNETVKLHIEKLFKTIETLDGWKYIGCDWTKHTKSRNSEELKKHILNQIKVHIKSDVEEDLFYELQLPELIEDQFFYIGGYLKVPIFQLYDYPIIYRKGVIRLRTNTITLALNLNKTDGNNLLIFNRQVPADLVLCCFYEPAELEEFMSRHSSYECPPLVSIYSKCINRWGSTTKENNLIELGSYFSAESFNRTKKADNLLFSLKVSNIVDYFSREFMTEESLLFEILHSLYQGPKSDTTVDRKRIRFLEYILSPLIKKIYDMIITLRGSKKIKFQISQSLIVDNCNVSDIVHFNFPINPVSEIASLCQTTLTGPGGFKKNNVPAHLRNLDDSQKGRICPADTPDRDGCGVVLNMVPTIKFDSSGRFSDKDEEIYNSYPISLVPFLEHDDPTRLQMASSQIKQSILINESEKPMIKSGIEDNYLENSTFLYRAKDDGVVMHLEPNFMVVMYQDKTTGIFKTSYRNMYLNTIDILDPLYQEGEEFKKDDILCQSRFLKDGELAIGRNLLTGITIWKGFNYEDGLVVRESVSKEYFTSLHSVDLTFTIETGQVLLSLLDDEYSPLPKIGQAIRKNEVIAKIKTLNGEEGFESINIEPYEVRAPIDCKITDIEIYPNSWNKKVKEFNTFIQNLIDEQSDRYVVLYNKLRRFIDKDKAEKLITVWGLTKLDANTKVGKYRYKSKKFNGILVKVHAVYEEKIGIGDKIANRHGNKGIIAKILPDELMPSLPDGRKLDIMLNPLSIISRMNVGQLYELHLTECLYYLKKKLSGMTLENQVKHLKGFLKIVDKTEDKWITEKVLKEYTGPESIYLIQPPYKSINFKDLDKAMKYTKSKYEYEIYDPSNNLKIENPISAGYLYWLKLVHRSSDKMSARSIGPYSKKTLQPLGGKSKQGGHRLGEMEVWALFGHGANNFAKDLLTVQADSPELKNKLLADILNNPDLALSENSDSKPQSLRLLEVYLRVIGLDLLTSVREAN
jgi:DNA-directed RNA polymerase beta subunit